MEVRWWRGGSREIVGGQDGVRLDRQRTDWDVLKGRESYFGVQDSLQTLVGLSGRDDTGSV